MYIYKENAKEDFKNRIIKHLFSNRIYKSKDLEVFCRLLISKNKHLISEDEIKKLYEDVKRKLEE